MCVASPGIVKRIENNMAEVDYNGNIVKAHTGVVKVQPGDYVLVHAGMVLQKMKPREAEDLRALFQELEELS